MKSAMKERSVSLKLFRFSQILVVGLLSIAGMFVLFTYGPLRAQTSGAQNSNFDLLQLSADARTLVAAISYVLEPEPADPVVDSRYESALFGQNFENSADKSVRSTLSPTNRFSAG